MSPNITTRWLALGLAASMGLLAPGRGRGDTVDASSTTLLLVRDQARAGTSYTIAPLYELLSVSARDIRNPFAENLQLVFSGWGAGSIGTNRVWYDANAPRDRVFGDIDVAYLQGEILKRSLQLRVGRQLVAGGVTSALQLDGASVLARLPYGLGVSAYVGSPVSQRFDDRGTEATFNPQRGDFAVGGRAYFTLPPWGEVGASVVNVEDRGDPSRRQIGVDLRLTPLRPLAILANTSYDLHESRWAEINLVGQVQVLTKLFASVDYRHVEPDLFLARGSILAVFAVDRRNEVGAAVQYGPWNAITLAGDYHLLQRDDGEGHRARARATWRPWIDTSLGVEIGKLDAPSNGYFEARAFGSRRMDRLTGTLEVQEYAFDQQVNGQRNSFIASATLGYVIGHGFAALVSGSGGATPYYERRFDVLAKLAYNQTYRLREVR